MSNRSATSSRPRLGRLVPAVLILAACGGAAAAPTASPAGPTGAIGTLRPSPTPVPGDPGNGNTGGIVFPPVDPPDDPLFGPANYVTPIAGTLNPHPVNVQLLRAVQREDGTILADLRWWSGVAPCNQLDHVEMARDEAARTIHLTVIEGAGKGDVACIEIAQLNATTVDLGTLAAGAWKLSAEGDAPTISLEVKELQPR